MRSQQQQKQPIVEEPIDDSDGDTTPNGRENGKEISLLMKNPTAPVQLLLSNGSNQLREQHLLLQKEANGGGTLLLTDSTTGNGGSKSLMTTRNNNKGLTAMITNAFSGLNILGSKNRCELVNKDEMKSAQIHVNASGKNGVEAWRDAMCANEGTKTRLIEKSAEVRSLEVKGQNDARIEIIRGQVSITKDAIVSNHREQMSIISNTHTEEMEVIKSNHQRDMKFLDNSHQQQMEIISNTHTENIEKIK